MSHVAVVGAGAWGTALASYLSGRGTAVRLWTWQDEHAERMRVDRENREFLKGVILSRSIEPTSDLGRALGDASFAVVALPTPAVRQVLDRARSHLGPGTLLLLASKGIEAESLMLPTEVAEDVLGGAFRERVVVLSGPSFAQEVAQGLPTNLVAACPSEASANAVQKLMAGERLRIYTSDDPIGVGVGGALKNVIAIAAGASDGLGFGHNTRAALITRGLSELGRLARAKGGQAVTLSGLAGLGDLVLTCTADLSRNRTVGFELGRGRALPDVLSGLGHVAEGVTTAKSAYHLASRLGVELPICNEVYRVLHEGKPVAEAVRELLTRPPRREVG